MTHARREDSRRKWGVIAVLAVLLHAMLLLFVRPETFDFLLPDIEAPSRGPSAGGAASPDAIIAIQIDIEGEETAPVTENLDAQPSPSPTASVAERNEDAADPEGDAIESLDIGEIVGEAGRPLGGSTTPRRATVPPRPVEITWPETRRLRHCIGRHVDVRILVNETGGIEQVEPATGDVPEDCRRAALDAARRIRFAPGTVDGVPAALWTQVRIDFERKR